MIVNPFSYLIEKLKGKVDKSGDTMSGILKIDQRNGTISTEGYSYIHLGNSTPTGTDKNSTGSIRLFAGSGKYANIVAGNLTANRAIVFPDNGGTVALTSDIITTTENFNGGNIPALDYNGSVLSLTVPSGYSLKSYMVETTGAYGTFINFGVSNGVLNATNCNPSHGADCTGKITCVWQK